MISWILARWDATPKRYRKLPRITDSRRSSQLDRAIETDDKRRRRLRLSHGFQPRVLQNERFSPRGSEIDHGAGLGAGLGAGFAVGNAMAGAMSDAMRRTSEAGTSASGGASVGTKCVKCGAELPAGSKFCRECGASQAPAKCANCQHELKPGAKFCDECGTKVG